jgi:hypothetical protein
MSRDKAKAVNWGRLPSADSPWPASFGVSARSDSRSRLARRSAICEAIELAKDISKTYKAQADESFSPWYSLARTPLADWNSWEQAYFRAIESTNLSYLNVMFETPPGEWEAFKGRDDLLIPLAFCELLESSVHGSTNTEDFRNSITLVNSKCPEIDARRVSQWVLKIPQFIKPRIVKHFGDIFASRLKCMKHLEDSSVGSFQKDVVSLSLEDCSADWWKAISDWEGIPEFATAFMPAINEWLPEQIVQTPSADCVVNGSAGSEPSSVSQFSVAQPTPMNAIDRYRFLTSFVPEIESLATSIQDRTKGVCDAAKQFLDIDASVDKIPIADTRDNRRWLRPKPLDRVAWLSAIAFLTKSIHDANASEVVCELLYSKELAGVKGAHSGMIIGFLPLLLTEAEHEAYLNQFSSLHESALEEQKAFHIRLVCWITARIQSRESVPALQRLQTIACQAGIEVEELLRRITADPNRSPNYALGCTNNTKYVADFVWRRKLSQMRKQVAEDRELFQADQQVGNTALVEQEQAPSATKSPVGQQPSSTGSGLGDAEGTPDEAEPTPQAAPVPPPLPDGFSGVSSFRFRGVEIDFGRAGKQLLLVESLWDSESKSPKDVQTAQHVIDSVYEHDNDKGDAAFRQLIADTRKKFQTKNCLLDIKYGQGKIQLVNLPYA